MSMICSACGATVERKDCHRNRYGEYICRRCQAAGIRFTWHQRLQHLRQGMLVKLLLGLLVLGLLLIWGLAVGFLDLQHF